MRLRSARRPAPGSGAPRRPWAGASLLLLSLLALPLAAAEEAPPLLVEPAAPLPPVVGLAPGAPTVLEFTVTNPAAEGYLVLASVDAPVGWNASVAPTSFHLPPAAEGAPRTLTLTLTPPLEAERRAYPALLRLAAGNSTTGTAFQHEVALPVEITHSALVLDMFRNPLPPPLDNAYGVFFLDILFWAAIGATIIALQDPIVRILARRAERHVGARIATMLRVPVFMALLFFGLTQSWGALPPTGWVSLGHRLLAAGTIFVSMFVVYKAYRALLLYYTENIAARTKSQLDDIVVPVLEKVGAVVIVVGGVLYSIGTLGIDLTAFVAGGVVVSMVLAFAAQDTLSNFFAGLFLLMDRPFLRGDDIMLVSGGPLSGDVFRVDQIGLRTTRLYHYRAHQLVVMPNNDLAKNPVVNLMYPDTLFRIVLDVGVAYGSDVAKVRDILLRAATEHPDTSTMPAPPLARFEGFGDSALLFKLYFFTRDVRRRHDAASDVRIRILEDFRRAGVEIPFPQRVVHLAGPTPAGAGDGPGPGARVVVDPRALDPGAGLATAGPPPKRS